MSPGGFSLRQLFIVDDDDKVASPPAADVDALLAGGRGQRGWTRSAGEQCIDIGGRRRRHLVVVIDDEKLTEGKAAWGHEDRLLRMQNSAHSAACPHGGFLFQRGRKGREPGRCHEGTDPGERSAAAGSAAPFHAPRTTRPLK
jgi:hypothetical protein